MLRSSTLNKQPDYCYNENKFETSTVFFFFFAKRDELRELHTYIFIYININTTIEGTFKFL